MIKRRSRINGLGLCNCGQDTKLIGCHLCHRCEVQSVLRQRKANNVVITGDMYAFLSPRSIKVGRSENVEKRKKRVSYLYFGGAKLETLWEAKGMGYLESFVHIILNPFRILQHREEFTCDLQTVMMAYDYVKNYDIAGRLHELQPYPWPAVHQGINGAASTAVSSSSSSADGAGRARSRSGARRRSRSSASSSTALAESEGEESS